MTIDPDVQAVCDEFGIQIIPANVVPQIGQTRAPITLEKIKRKHGIDHMRFVVGTLAETANNRALLDETIFWVCSDMVRAFKKNYPAIMEHDLDRWYGFWDQTPVGYIQHIGLDLEGITSKRRAIIGMLYERAYYLFGPMAGQGDLLSDRRRA
ncbi:hypothetical protein G6K93_07660 [Agrobacterium rhizogenes]|uniref:hypothetical protein n=1 Tax=Rhizobium rhizogenes TaxID=359 RepID=UPI001573782A|nr:hypothetical protein [Rhizobium rhizogenes]NTF54901.1 hypothetical protein [Rhizobium rhizogenes]NTF74481.1 hypothetical protein [Rhizobium rhizogenes]NTG07228.1 hypothetical protein [Rhizobium rhizogenes]NTJ46888.1 hypothetical protein [Rhizobium rhizogenes]